MNGAEVQALIEQLRERVIGLPETNDERLISDAADALEGFQRAIIAHHDIATLSDGVLADWAAQTGSECPVCRKARQ